MELKIEKPWEQVAAKMMEHEKNLTKEDLHLEKGKEDELLQRLSAKMNRPPSAIKEWIESLSFNA